MQIFSIGNLYIGKDVSNYTEVCVHLGNYRLDWQWKPKSHGSRPTAKESN
jgi:hypothetical protein